MVPQPVNIVTQSLVVPRGEVNAVTVVLVPRHGVGLTARTDAWLNRFATFNSKPSFIASLVLLTRKCCAKFKSVSEYIGIRAPAITLSTTRFPVAVSRWIFANVPRRSPKYWQLEV